MDDDVTFKAAAQKFGSLLTTFDSVPEQAETLRMQTRSCSPHRLEFAGG